MLHFTVKIKYFAYCGMLLIPFAVIPNTRNMEIYLHTSIFIER
jgi:hypothetical protein